MIGANNEVVEKLARIQAGKPVGSPGTEIFGGYIVDGENSNTLRGSEKYRTYSNMLVNVSIIGAGVRQLLNLVGNAKWTFEAADKSNEAIKLKDHMELIKDSLHTPWAKVVRKAATYKFYGFGVQVWTPRRMDDGTIGIYRVDSRPQSTIERWERDEWGDVETIFQRSPQTMQEVPIPRFRCLYLVDDALSDNPEGLGLFRHCAETSRRLARFEQLEGWGFETDLKGVPIGRGPYTELREKVATQQITEADRIALEKPLEGFIKKHIRSPESGLLLDSMTYEGTLDGKISNIPQWDIELLKSSSSSQPDVANSIVRLTSDLARILHAEGLLLGSGPNGSQALSKDKSANLTLMVESMLVDISEMIARDFVKPHAEMNGWDEKLLPKPTAEAIGFKSVETIVAAMADLASAGVPLEPGDQIIDHVREILGAPAAKMLSGSSDSDMVLSGGNSKKTTETILNEDLDDTS